MGIQFNADEIFEIAERIEKNGARFYRKAADSTSDDDAKKFLLALAAMEDDHEKTFQGMRSSLSGKEKERNLFDPADEVVLYLQAFADGHIFDSKGDPCDLLTGSESVAEVLKKAIGLEKDSIVFYLGIKDVVPESVGKGRIEDIIQEERNHIATLAAKLSSVK